MTKYRYLTKYRHIVDEISSVQVMEADSSGMNSWHGYFFDTYINFYETYKMSALPHHLEGTKTLENLEACFAGESMAHMKYLHFAKICRDHGDEDTAKAFEDTAAQEIKHALGHADLLFPKDQMNPVKALEYAIAGETYEYTEMYPTFASIAAEENQKAALKEMGEQIDESKEHAQFFEVLMTKANKRFAALAKVEERHAGYYKSVLNKVKT
jgi:rubrerythrin